MIDDEEKVTTQEEPTSDSGEEVEAQADAQADAQDAEPDDVAIPIDAVQKTVDPARPNKVVLDRWPTEAEKKAARGE